MRCVPSDTSFIPREVDPLGTRWPDDGAKTDVYRENDLRGVERRSGEFAFGSVGWDLRGRLGGRRRDRHREKNGDHPAAHRLYGIRAYVR